PMFLFSVKIVYAILFITFTAVWFSNNDFVFFPQTSSVNDVVETYTGDSGPIELSDGDYTGTSYGYHDLPVTVVVTIENGYITAIDIIDDGATAPERGMDFEAAAIEIANNIMSAQSTSVDAIAGATHTTEGIIDAVIDALR
nr:FMN-binding protein [Bacillota bacterium]